MFSGDIDRRAFLIYVVIGQDSNITVLKNVILVMETSTKISNVDLVESLQFLIM